MKKPPVRTLVCWIVLVVVGVCGLLLQVLKVVPPPWGLLSAVLLWCAAVVWIVSALVGGRSRAKRAKESYSGDRMVYERMSGEVARAAKRYSSTVSSRSLFRRRALYERPWFLLCGPAGSGKSTLLKGSGLHFPVTYPSEADGAVVSGSPQVSWFFGNEAVWVDLPGSFIDGEGGEELNAFAAALNRLREEKPVDGVAFVVNAGELLDAEDSDIKRTAGEYRSRLDALIAAWGIEFPVYLIFNHADRIFGYEEFFGDMAEESRKRIFGATLPAQSRKLMPRLAFAEEYNLLRKSLTDLRLDRLNREKHDERKRKICRFVIHFDSMQEKLGAFVAELFKPSSYVGRPLFRGFYFTSCRRRLPEREDSGEQGSRGDVGMTIANHPLNPRRASRSSGPSPGPAPQGAGVTSMFVLPLFRRIMVRDRRLVTATAGRTKSLRLRRLGVMAVIAAGVIALGGLFTLSGRASRRLMSRVGEHIVEAARPTETLPERYERLDALGRAVKELRPYEQGGLHVIPGLGLLRAEQPARELKGVYQVALRKLIVQPAAEYLEYKIRGSSSSFGRPVGEEYENLYRCLKAYLSISEQVSSRPRDIDTTFLRAMLSEALTQRLLGTFRQSRLPRRVETIIQSNLGEYLRYLARLEVPLIQENQRLVAHARKRLRRLPDAENLYDAVVNRLSREAPVTTLDEMLGRSEEGILQSGEGISLLFTQEGWDQYVREGIAEASKDPYKVDWVIGLAEDQVPDALPDSRRLREEMTAAYLGQFRREWLTFLGSVHIEPFGDLARSSRILEKLAAENSELQVVLQTVAEHTVIKPRSELAGAAEGALDKVKNLKGVSRAASKASKGVPGSEEAAAKLRRGMKSPEEEIEDTFDPLRTFVRSSGGTLGGYQGYRDKLLTLVEQLRAIDERGEAHAVAVFNGKESDPLAEGWRFTESVLGGLPTDLSESLRGMLLDPLAHTGVAASAVLRRTLNDKWQEEVIKPFTSRFSGRYPFSRRGEDAAFSAVMDFFRPTTGDLWGFYDRTLSSYIVESPTGWMVRSIGSLDLDFNSDLAKTLSRAGSITEMFFKRDGTLRTMVFTITPDPSNKHEARIEVDGQVCEFKAGAGSSQLRWPVESTNRGAVLSAVLGKGYSQEMAFKGPWGFMKLVDAATVQTINANTIRATWKLNVQNMYLVHQSFRIAVSESRHPFAEPVFVRFDCPTVLVKEESGDAS